MEKHRVRQNEQKRKMMIIAVLSVIVIVSVIAGAITGFKPKGMSGKAESSSQTDSITVEENHEDSAETEEAVNALIRQYRAALASADIDTIAKLYQTDKVETADTITATSRVITGYMNTKCYIRSGLDEGTKVVFIYDDLQIADVDVLVPNLSYVYVKKAADGSYYIDPGTYNEETLSYEYDRDITDYVDELSNDAQISALYTDVNTKFEQICQNNQKLSDFMKKLNDAAALHGTSESGTTESDSKAKDQSGESTDSANTSADSTDSTKTSADSTGTSDKDTGAAAESDSEA